MSNFFNGYWYENMSHIVETSDDFGLLDVWTVYIALPKCVQPETRKS